MSAFVCKDETINRVVKSLACWMYQCSEGDIDKNDLYQVMEAVQGWIAETIVNRMPEYDRLGWD